MKLDLYLALARLACHRLYIDNEERVAGFEEKLKLKKANHKEHAVVLLCADDPNGKDLADVMMPGFDWDAVRAAGHVPVARALVKREGMQVMIDAFDPNMGALLREASGLAVIVVDQGLVEIYNRPMGIL